MCFLAPVSIQADEPQVPEIILIRHVRLAAGESPADTALVSILIKNGKLDVVTRDKIPSSEATLSFDAQGGTLIGKLSIGELASFLILNDDPRENVEILLDTSTHARFAIYEGEIYRNDLPALTVPDPPKRSGWLAYTPPPMALPLSYKDESKWNRWDTRYISGIFLAALAMDRQWWLSQDGESDQQVGDLADYDGGDVRAFRFGAIGTLNFATPWVYTVFIASRAFDRGYDSDDDDDFTFFDYRLDVPLPWQTTLSVGKQKEPISRERIESLLFIGMQERSSQLDAMLPSRNVGVVLSGTAFSRRMAWGGGAFNNWFDVGQSFDESASQFVGRVTGLAAVSADESNLLHVGLGVRYTNAKEGVRYATTPEFYQAPVFVDTDVLDPESATTFNVELTWRRGPFFVGGEFTQSNLDAPALGDPGFWGYNLGGWWTVTGEMRGYDRNAGVLRPVPVSRSVYQGGWGTWEVGGRWSDIDLAEGTVDGGRMRIVSAGVNWWLTPVFMVGLNYRHIVLDRYGTTGHSDGLNTRIVLMLE